MASSKPSPELHPESKAYLELYDSFMKAIFSPEKCIETVRKILDDCWRRGRKVAEYDGKTEEIFVPSNEVQGGIPVYVYTPRSVPPDPTIMIYYHGGGNIMGAREQVEDTCKILSSKAQCIVVNVEYRLAPEHKFPAMADDAVTVARWVLSNPTLVGGTQKSKVGVSGDSAGGLLTASVSQDVPGLAFQIPVYALLSGTTRSLPSFKESIDDASEGFMDWMECLLADRKEDLDNPRYHILANENYDHLPPTLLIVAEIDLIKDDSHEYAKKLEAAGVENEVYIEKGAVHGYYTDPGLCPVLSNQSFNVAAEFIKRFNV